MPCLQIKPLHLRRLWLNGLKIGDKGAVELGIALEHNQHLLVRP
jgi:hypothetical protein